MVLLFFEIKINIIYIFNKYSHIIFLYIKLLIISYKCLDSKEVTVEST
jgi:hypothetical protein